MKDLSGKNGELLVLFKDLLVYAGLPVKEVTAVAGYGLERNLEIGALFSTHIDLMDQSTSHPFVSALKRIRAAMDESNLAKDAVSVVEEKLKSANSEIDFLRTEVAKLAKYETHYNLEMKLRHGEKKSE